MKFLFLLLIVLSSTLTAMPSHIEKALCQKLSEENSHCGDGSTLDIYHYEFLEDDKLLIYFILDTNTIPFYEYITKRPKVAVIIDKNAKWRIIEKYKGFGYIAKVKQDFKKGIWVMGSKGMESPFPSLIYSKDAIEWKVISLPKEINYEYEIESFCFEKEHLLVTFKKYNSDKFFWRVDFTSILDKYPQWNRVKSKSNCISKVKPQTGWSTRELTHNRVFEHSKTKAKIYSAESTGHTFALQIGVFEKKSNLEIVKNKLPKLPYYDYIYMRKNKNAGKVYMKLLVGIYRTKEKANIMLKQFKKEHPNNRYIQNAFIVDLGVEPQGVSR